MSLHIKEKWTIDFGGHIRPTSALLVFICIHSLEHFPNHDLQLNDVTADEKVEKKGHTIYFPH